ncbi:hypothetical protein L3X38_025755 [Prunus dulcis]|uniref:Uncharacterized protein n=1 Tax=Prunus dulcis TaxID=3755 RepID=A0AAD4W458_PRUDU|nr:hypothetical protein L3X38_025755 [Prunus dulcis]
MLCPSSSRMRAELTAESDTARNRPDETLNVHLLGFNYMLYFRSRLNASARFLTWSARSGALTSMSST